MSQVPDDLADDAVFVVRDDGGLEVHCGARAFDRLREAVLAASYDAEIPSEAGECNRICVWGPWPETDAKPPNLLWDQAAALGCGLFCSLTLLLVTFGLIAIRRWLGIEG